MTPCKHLVPGTILKYEKVTVYINTRTNGDWKCRANSNFCVYYRNTCGMRPHKWSCSESHAGTCMYGCVEASLNFAALCHACKQVAWVKQKYRHCHWSVCLSLKFKLKHEDVNKLKLLLLYSRKISSELVTSILHWCLVSTKWNFDSFIFSYKYTSI